MNSSLSFHCLVIDWLTPHVHWSQRTASLTLLPKIATIFRGTDLLHMLDKVVDKIVASQPKEIATSRRICFVVGSHSRQECQQKGAGEVVHQQQQQRKQQHQ